MKKVLIADDQKGWRDYHTKVVNEIFEQDVYIDVAEWARVGYDKILENNSEPYDVIITDLQMEDDFAPKLAGEWFVEQIKSLLNYYKTKIIIISASPQIKYIAENLSVDYIPKPTAISFPDAYKELLLNK